MPLLCQNGQIYDHANNRYTDIRFTYLLTCCVQTQQRLQDRCLAPLRHTVSVVATVAGQLTDLHARRPPSLMHLHLR